ncbi:ead/Ea22-like family protein [Salmonella enterica subsp. enterica]|nr:ead/Ea22-like family protein [Salmonella enterica subsp. enterica serovar Duesseldorf]ECG3587200.1 ead/Ea22-like family protein [Salmonella enterica subsp. enterica serovar Duesseldorf]
MTALNKQALRSKARSASAGEWIKESGDGWEAVCSTNDQANGNFIIAHFEGPDALANREFVQAANPVTVLDLLDELEAAENLAKQQGNIAVALLDEVTTLRRNADDKAPDLRSQLEEAENRIAELEAVAVVVKQFDDFQIVHYGGSEDYAKGYIDCQNNYNKALIAAGIGVKGE